MLRKTLFWILAVIITASTAIYQRTTGPTYSTAGSRDIGGYSVAYDLATSHGGEGDQAVAVYIGDAPIRGVLHYKRYKLDEPFVLQDMIAMNDSLVGYLPHQPPAGKLEYYVELLSDDESVFVPGPQTVVIRFKGEVPLALIIVHASLMFFGMLWSNRTGLEALSSKAKTRNLTLWTTIILFVGGLIFGPMVQKLAFGDLWTGVPFGWDLTDNKTLIFVIVWAFTLWRHRGGKNPRYIVLAAAVITLIMYMIPHSLLGSELDYTTGEIKTG